ncbi:uncharacterized protein LOC143366371 [Andrena cerasifolii]|uniref:uncharacterized protein LOC143366371 n=1 Tax=Andrena cerasifolii TaxID=2819439 RepID=UPI0040381EAC
MLDKIPGKKQGFSFSSYKIEIRRNSFVPPLIPLDNLLSGNEGSQREQSAPEKEVEVVVRQPVPEVVETPTQEPEEQALNAELLNALGKRVDSARPLTPPLHKDIMIRWGDILKEGLLEEEKKELQKKYPTLENCTTMEPPKLNPEIKVTVLEPIIVRGNKIEEKQQKVSVCLAAMGQLFSNLLKGDMPDSLTLIATLSDLTIKVNGHHKRHGRPTHLAASWSPLEGSLVNAAACATQMWVSLRFHADHTQAEKLPDWLTPTTSTNQAKTATAGLFWIHRRNPEKSVSISRQYRTVSVNPSTHYTACGLLYPSHISDHALTYTALDLPSLSRSHQYLQRRNLKAIPIDEFDSALQCIDWSPLYDATSTDDKGNILHHITPVGAAHIDTTTAELEQELGRLLILSKLNTSLKESLNATNLDEWLFGKDSEQTLKAAKLLERSSKNLKLMVKSFSSGSGTKNSKGPCCPSNYYRVTRGR